jgi:hypothetical protein
VLYRNRTRARFRAVPSVTPTPAHSGSMSRTTQLRNKCRCARRYKHNSFIHSFIHSAVCLTTGPLPLPKRVLLRVRSSASSFNFQYLLFSLRLSSSCLRLLLLLSVTSILPSIYPSVTCFKMQFLSKMWQIQLAFLLFIVCRIFLSSLTLYNTS